MNDLELIILPDPEDPGAAQVMVDAIIGDRPYRLLLDTGAAHSSVVLDEHTAQFDVVGEGNVSGLFAVESEDRVRVPSVEMGPIIRKDFVLHRFQSRAEARPGVIGLDILSDYSWQFSFERSRALINPLVETDRVALNSLTLDSNAHPYLSVRLGDQELHAVWDSGAGVTVVDLAVIKRLPSQFAEVESSVGRDSAGATMETRMFRMQGAMLGGSEFPPHRVAGVDMTAVNSGLAIPMDLVLGYTTIRLADWLIDFPGKTWALLRPPG